METESAIRGDGTAVRLKNMSFVERTESPVFRNVNPLLVKLSLSTEFHSQR